MSATVARSLSSTYDDLCGPSAEMAKAIALDALQYPQNTTPLKFAFQNYGDTFRIDVYPIGFAWGTSLSMRTEDFTIWGYTEPCYQGEKVEIIYLKGSVSEISPA